MNPDDKALQNHQPSSYVRWYQWMNLGDKAPRTHQPLMITPQIQSRFADHSHVAPILITVHFPNCLVQCSPSDLYYVLWFIKVKNDKETTLSIINSLFI